MKPKVRSYSKQEMAAIYSVSRKTFHNWLQKIVELETGTRRVLTPKEVAIIFDTLGEPEL